MSTLASIPKSNIASIEGRVSLFSNLAGPKIPNDLTDFLSGLMILAMLSVEMLIGSLIMASMEASGITSKG